MLGLQIRGASGFDTEFPYRVRIVDMGNDPGDEAPQN